MGVNFEQQPEGSQEQALGGAEEAEIAHLHKAPGQDVLEEAMDEFLGGESAELELVGCGRAIAKSNLIVFEFYQAAVGDGDPEDVRSEILEGSTAIADRFAVDDPFLLPDGSRDIVGEVGLLEGVKEFGPENSGECLDGEQEMMVGREPGAVIGR